MFSVCVFCGSSTGLRSEHAEAAATFGGLVAERGLRLVFGGGRVGLMGVVADAAGRSGGAVVGVIPRALRDRELAHEGVQELHVVETLHERKALMAELADAFVALPGGLGTLDELAEAVTWRQLGLHQKPIGLLDVGGYYRHLLAFVDHAAEEGFVALRARDSLVVSDDPAALLDGLAGRPEAA